MTDAAETPEGPTGEQLRARGAKCMEAIRASEKREDKWRKDAEAAEKAYSADGDSKNTGKLYDFNILFSNVETIVPAIYNSTPIPDVRRRYIEAIGDPPQAPPQPQQQEGQPVDPNAVRQFQMAMAQFQKAQQAYAQKEQADKDAKDLGDMIERAIADQIDDNRLDKEIEANAQDAFLAGRGVVRLGFDATFGENDAVSGERFIFEAVSWRDYRQGPAARWDAVSWIAFRHTIPRETLENQHTDADLYKAQSDEKINDDDSDEIPVWEFWDKSRREVLFIDEADGRIRKITPDPLGLKNFFPIPEPIQPITLTGKTTPVNPFKIYKKLADELDLITKRINKIMSGLKVRGLVAGDATDVMALAKLDDNELGAATNLEGLAQTKGIENAIMWWPIQQAALVLKELYQQREITKAAIYEITGISDIVRGASNATETATAQQIKTQWGSLRIQKMQRMIERQVRDIFVMMSEIIPSKFSPQTLKLMTGIDVSPGMQQMMSQPSTMCYRIDVESDSTVRADLTRQKQDMTEFLTGTGTFFSVVGPLIQEQPAMGKPMAEIYASFARVFKLGKQAEDAIEQFSKMAEKAADQAANNPKPDPEMEKMKADAALQQQKANTDMQAKQQDGALKQQAAEQDMAMKREEHAMKMRELEAQSQRDAVVFGNQQETQGFAREKHQFDMQTKRGDADNKRLEAGLPSPEDWQSINQGLQQIGTLVVQSQQAAQQGLEKLAGMIDQLGKIVAAPNELVRDPKTGRAVGSKKVLQ